MFRQRTSRQTPSDQFVANFQRQFPELVATTRATMASAGTATIDYPVMGGAPLQERSLSLGSSDLYSDQDPTPRAPGEQWPFTPTLLDANSFTFANYTTAPPSYYASPPNGSNAMFSSQNGNLQGVPMPLGTPMSMATTLAASEASLHSTPLVDMNAFQSLPPQQLHHFNHFVHAASQPIATFPPSSYVHHDVGFETMEHGGSPINTRPPMVDSASQLHATMSMRNRQYNAARMDPMLPSSAEKFRFHTSLHAPTAMVKDVDEIPVTYLNKGQAYSLSVRDTSATMPVAPGTQYRTFIRISFEDDQQRQKPAVCWGLWKEGRGTSEAHQRGGKLQAVEFVESREPTETEDKRPRVEIESSSFDGFSVIWTPGPGGVAECNLTVRFNFLSTDFSHSKGVKGIPVRLCAKTCTYTGEAPTASEPGDSETCYCKVKLFRDHGAERKLSNDVAHIKKSIDKIKQQLAAAENGLKDFGKRKRPSVAQGKMDSRGPGKVQKHRRTWSLSSNSSGGGGGSGGRGSVEEDMHFKLQTLEDMFTSTRTYSILYLRGDDLDDPDTHPVSLPGEGPEGSSWNGRGVNNTATDSLVSPSPSSLSLGSQGSATGGMWGSAELEGRFDSDKPVKVSKMSEDGSLNGWIDALGVDSSYRPPPEKTVKPVACFYVKRKTASESSSGPNYHKAVYLAQRTAKEFNRQLARKWDLDPSKIVRTVQVLKGGLCVEMDDDMIRELREAQDMILEVSPIGSVTEAVKCEWELAMESKDSDIPTPRLTPHAGYEFRLTI